MKNIEKKYLTMSTSHTSAFIPKSEKDINEKKDKKNKQKN